MKYALVPQKKGSPNNLNIIAKGSQVFLILSLNLFPCPYVLSLVKVGGRDALKFEAERDREV